MRELRELIERVEKRTGRDRDLDMEIAEALGGSVRRVSRLGLNGRSPGSYRVFWPHSDCWGPGHVIPYYTKDDRSRQRAVALLRAKAQESEAAIRSLAGSKDKEGQR